MDLATPHDEVCSHKFGNICHVNMEQRRVGGDVDCLNCCSRRSHERRVEGFEKKKKMEGMEEEDEVDG